MARQRTVKPDFFNDEKLAKISRDARLAYIGMWIHSDDFGVVRGSITWLRSNVYPYDEDVTTANLKAWIEELADLERILPFESEGESYYYMPTFLQHQTVDKPNVKERNPIPPKALVERSAKHRIKFGDISTTHPADAKSAHTYNKKLLKGVKKTKGLKDCMPGAEPKYMPPELANLPMYAENEKLVAQWPELIKGWKDAFAYLDIISEVKKAHGWEVANPRRRKKDKIRFIYNWLARADGWRAQRKDQSGQTREEKARQLEQDMK